VRRIKRMELPPAALAYLNQRQQQANEKLASGNLDASTEWKSARQTQAVAAVVATLRRMTGERERCMYCLDSHGSDIEHFRPKADYPKRMFRWRNLLLCCSECGRFKGNKFPLQGKRPLLIDPSKEEPWRYLDFDPDTGNLSARFDLQAKAYCPKGEKTVEVLQLNWREALATGYRKTYRRLAKKIQHFLDNPNMPADTLIEQLRDADEHGLLGWCFIGTGQNETPFLEFRHQHPALWQDCAKALEY